MSKIKLYQIDAFAEKPFSGNPAAILILKEWLPDETMQNIALENNLSETAFIVLYKSIFNIRYFTPNTEVELCGHATLASAFVIYNILNYSESVITFRTRHRGDLFATKNDEIITLNFPSESIHEGKYPNSIIDAIGLKPKEVHWGKNDLMLVYENENQIKSISPNFDLLRKENICGIIVTAMGNDVDFVSRFFDPFEGIDEDPVTGSAHTKLIPYWNNKLGKTKMVAKQLSKRGGTLYCEYKGDRVKIGGKALHYLSGTITI